ncbi:hypothetical protein D3C71_687790 [compost metagenome]
MPVNLFDVGLVITVVAVHQTHLTIMIADRQFRTPLPALLPPVLGAHRATALQQGKMMNVRHRRALHLHRIILLGLGAEVGQMVGGKIDPADEGDSPVHHHNLAVQASEPVGADAQPLGCRVEHLQVHASAAEGGEIPGAQFAAAKSVETGGDAHAPLSGVDEHRLQLLADFVFEHDEGFQEDLGLGLAHGLEHPWEIGFAVFQQLDAVVALPAVLDVDRCGLAHWRRGNRLRSGFFHR